MSFFYQQKTQHVSKTYIYMHFFYSQKTQHISKTHASISRKPSKFASNSTSTKFRFAPNKNPKHVLKAYTNSSSTIRKPNLVKPILLAVENPAIGKNCFHFDQQKTQDVSSQCRKTSISQKNIHQATYSKWNFQQISEMCNRKPSSKIILPQLEKSAGFKSAFNQQ